MGQEVAHGDYCEEHRHPSEVDRADRGYEPGIEDRSCRLYRAHHGGGGERLCGRPYLEQSVIPAPPVDYSTLVTPEAGNVLIPSNKDFRQQLQEHHNRSRSSLIFCDGCDGWKRTGAAGLRSIVRRHGVKPSSDPTDA